MNAAPAPASVSFGRIVAGAFIGVVAALAAWIGLFALAYTMGWTIGSNHGADMSGLANLAYVFVIGTPIAMLVGGVAGTRILVRRTRARMQA